MSSNQQPIDPVGRSCPLCDEGDATPFTQKGSLRLVRCRRCSMIYADPVAPELASGKFYDRLGLPFYLSPDKLAGDFAPVRFERELRWFQDYCRGGAVLDVGCSTGGFLFQLKARFPGDFTVTGTDVAGAALDYAESRGIEVIREPFLDFDFRNRRFDAVTFWAVVEHLIQPKLVPNMKSLAVRLLGARYRYIMPDHVNYFTAGALRRFAATEPAFEVVRLGQSHFNPLVILKDFRRNQERVADPERARLLNRTTAFKQHPLLKPAKWLYNGVERLLAAMGLADNLIIVLRKKF
ncbi:MAG: hypothetical protein DME18_15655 [Verrucomicrobia bacterium]|nr:MAG: hypothetical protein DME18_15655 [Verrucomicrobiota bacterium]